MKKLQISELTIHPVKKRLGGRKDMAELANGTWLTLVGDGTGYDSDGNQWTEIPGQGYANVPITEIDWSGYTEEDA